MAQAIAMNPAQDLGDSLFSLRKLLRPDRRKFLGIDKYPDVLSNPDFFKIIVNTLVIIISVAVVTLVLGILLAGLQSLAHDQIEACQIDGGGPLALFRYIVLPHLQRYIELAVLMEILFILSVFGVIFILTSGGPGIQTTNLAYGIYQEAFQRWDIGEASAMGISAIIRANIIVLVFVRVLRRGQAEEMAE